MNAHTQESSAHPAGDNYLAHCKVHTDRTVVRQRKRSFATYTVQSRRRFEAVQTARMAAAAKLQEEAAGETSQQRIARKLAKSQRAFARDRQNRHRPWLPTQKIPRWV